MKQLHCFSSAAAVVTIISMEADLLLCRSHQGKIAAEHLLSSIVEESAMKTSHTLPLKCFGTAQRSCVADSGNLY